MNNRHRLFRQAKHPREVSDYFHVYNLSNVMNVVYWQSYFKMVEGVEGSIVECGIGRGRSLITMMAIESLFRTYPGYQKRIIYGLDSFEGFPEPAREDVSPRNPQKGEWSTSPNGQFSYSIENLKEIIKNADLEDEFGDDLVLVKGFFEQTAYELDVENIAILHLDGDLYNSIRHPLVALADKISIGGVIVVDDYMLRNDDQGSEAFPGARKAVDEFLSSRNDFSLEESIRGTPYLIRVC